MLLGQLLEPRMGGWGNLTTPVCVVGGCLGGFYFSIVGKS